MAESAAARAAILGDDPVAARVLIPLLFTGAAMYPWATLDKAWEEGYTVRDQHPVTLRLTAGGDGRAEYSGPPITASALAAGALADPQRRVR